MRTKLFVFLAFVAAACSSGQETIRPAATESTPPARTFALAYRYLPGDHREFTFTLDQRIQMAVEGAGLLEGEAPGNVDVTTNVGGTVFYDIAEGPESGTVGLSISGIFDRVTTSGTVDGEEITEEMTGDGTVPDLLQEPDLTIVVDEHGNIVSVTGGEVLDQVAFFGDPFSQLGDLTSGGLSNHFGPAFPDRELKAGETWTLERTEAIEGLTDEITVNTTYEVRGTETLAGREYVAIDFETRTSEISIDLSEMFRSLFEAFGEAGSELGEGTSGIPEVLFVITVAPSKATGTIWFDESGGITHRFEQATAATMDMVMDTSGNDGSSRANVHLNVDMDLVAELTGTVTP